MTPWPTLEVNEATIKRLRSSRNREHLTVRIGGDTYRFRWPSQRYREAYIEWMQIRVDSMKDTHDE